MTPRVAVFDVLGTVLDERGSFVALAQASLPSTSDAAAFAGEWLDAVSATVSEVASGRTPWRPWDDIIRSTLTRLDPRADELGYGARLRTVGHALAAWPDSRAGIAAIRETCDVIALSNAGLSPLIDCSRANGLAWDAVLSSELVRSAKPDPRVYRFLLDHVGADPEEVVMVAAHPWDLRAAAEQGMRTAYIRRSGEGDPAPGDHFDWVADDLIELGALLSAEDGGDRGAR